MATPHFDYPNYTSPSATFEFDHAEFFPLEPEYVANQSVGRAEDKSIPVVYTMGNPLIRRPLTYRIPRTDLAALKVFLFTTVNWAESQFDFTDSRGDVHTVRLVMDRIKFTEAAYGIISGTLDLEELT